MWQLGFFLVLSVTITGSLSVSWDMVMSQKIIVSRGEDTVLSCSFTHPREQDYSGIIRVKWIARESNAPPFFSCSVKNDSTSGANTCSVPRLRFSLSGDPRRGELSLLIREAQLTDNGAYYCRVELDSSWAYFQKETQLLVTAEPQILSLSVLETPSGSDKRLQCEVEGHPRPNIVWLSASRKLLEKQGQSSESGLYRWTSSVPYLEEEVLTCRVESKLGEAERTYPADNTLMIIVAVCGLVLLLSLSAGITTYCWRKRAQADAHPVYVNCEVAKNHHLQGPDAAAHTEIQLVYSTITTSSLPPPTRQHEESDVCYTPVNVQ